MLKLIYFFLIFGLLNPLQAQDIKLPNVSGTFYPDNPQELSGLVDNLLNNTTEVKPSQGSVFVLISPHAGYNYSGAAAAFGYNNIKDKLYKTVIVIGPSHYYGFNGISVYPDGLFKTPLGNLKIDSEFTRILLGKEDNIYFEPLAFEKEHSVEVQLPFLQKTLSEFKIVPIVMGDCRFSDCQKLAGLLKGAIGVRKDVLIVASSDMYHGYDYEEAQVIDNLSLSYIKKMDSKGLYDGLKDGKLQLCGGFGVVAALILAHELGYNKLDVLKYTNSAVVTGNKTKGVWTVGYASCAIYDNVK